MMLTATQAEADVKRARRVADSLEICDVFIIYRP
jgi:hypothetical protein